MKEADIQLVRARAKERCEYCRIPQAFDESPFQIDHIIALKHHGTDDANNLALACLACNNHKGPNIAGMDGDTGQVCRLFHPRTDRWSDHFVWDGPTLQALTTVGRVTIDVLEINLSYRIELRASLLVEGIELASE